jgi:hypothetical protein
MAAPRLAESWRSPTRLGRVHAFLAGRAFCPAGRGSAAGRHVSVTSSAAHLSPLAQRRRTPPRSCGVALRDLFVPRRSLSWRPHAGAAGVRGRPRPQAEGRGRGPSVSAKRAGQLKL